MPFLLALLCAALVGAVAYNLASARRHTARPYRRTLADFYVTWRCLACGHELEDRGAVGTRACPACGKQEMYVCIRHACPRHGVFPVAFEHDSAGDPVRVKVADGQWLPYTDEDMNINIRCPQCGEFMMPADRARPVQQQRP